MRIIFYTGKGGVGKTTLAASTGALLASRGVRTLVMSLDRAHSLADSFDLPRSLLDQHRGQPVKVAENLDIQEVDILEEVDRHWDEVHGYLSALLSVTGVEEFLAEEIAILPGMEETSCLLYINDYLKNDRYDVLLLDCAPTGESLRFISIPSILQWYMERFFQLERTIVKVARPVVQRLTDVPLPQDAYFANVENLFQRLDGIEEVLTDPRRTTVRIVTNPERMVVKESQRALMYFSLYGLKVDAVLVNRILPEHATGDFLDGWRRSQEQALAQIDEIFSPLPIWPVHLRDQEAGGLEDLEEIGRALYARKDPATVFSKTEPVKFQRRGGKVVLKLHLPFAAAEDFDVVRVEETLVVQVGSHRRHILLPRTVPAEGELEARRVGEYLEVHFR